MPATTGSRDEDSGRNGDSRGPDHLPDEVTDGVEEVA